MKYLSVLFSLSASLSAFAQYAPQEIKKFRISKITKLSTTNGSEQTKKDEIWYDDKGNDTSESLDGEVYKRVKYEYNTKKQAVKSTSYHADGTEIETAIYTYKPDGSYMIGNTDKSFGMTDYTYYNKAGKKTKSVSPDKTERAYSYDAKGRLLSIKSKPDDSGAVVTDIQYAYNAKGQITREVNKGDYKWTKTYTYDGKGLIAKCRNNSVTDGVADPEVTSSYEYEFLK
jgi:YD repeat-containing protein